jgi:release factor glutamine methyltransferase
MGELLGEGRSAVVLQGRQELSDKLARKYWNWIKDRGDRLPLAYILGYQPFLGLNIAVTRDCLIPRPETEELVLESERLAKVLNLASPKILEIGTGTGCVAIALAQLLPEATIFATDVSDRALDLARHNALTHHVSNRIRFIREDLFSNKQGLRGWADILVSNPPYIPTKDLESLSAEVQYEPRLALDGGPQGMDAIKAIVAMAPHLLKPDGYLVLEIESRQGLVVTQLLNKSGFTGVVLKKDAQGHDRIVTGKMIK